jgi:nucleotide-binding universal stress UspA family protein
MDENRIVMDRIVVAVDGSPASAAATLWAASEAAMRQLELTIVHVLATSSGSCTATAWARQPVPAKVATPAFRRGEKTIEDALDVVARASGSRQPKHITSRLCLGPVVPTLWEFTQEGAQMIVLGCRSRNGACRASLGSVAEAVLQIARCPVTVVHHDRVSRVQDSRAPVVVGVDSSPACELATAIAFDEASRRAVELVAVHATNHPDVSVNVRDRSDAWHLEAEYVLAHALAGWQVRYPDVTVRRIITADNPVQALLKQSRHAQLVVVGGRRYHSFVAEPSGAVSSAVAQACRLPVIVARRKPRNCFSASPPHPEFEKRDTT